jgi:uncharacterized protein (DUF488 family)
MGIPIIDTRYTPDSKRWQWKKEHLERIQGLTYHWIQELGNLKYKEALTGKFTEQVIEIKDIDVGIQKLADVLKRHGKACLLCACADKNRCHRRIVAQEAKNQLGVNVVHI